MSVGHAAAAHHQVRPCATVRSMARRACLAFLVSCFLTATLAGAALAGDGGEGTYGKADDKVITNFGFGLMIFFTVLVISLSLIQHLLEKRKRPK
jgi:hypothetical protein